MNRKRLALNSPFGGQQTTNTTATFPSSTKYTHNYGQLSNNQHAGKTSLPQ